MARTHDALGCPLRPALFKDSEAFDPSERIVSGQHGVVFWRNPGDPHLEGVDTGPMITRDANIFEHNNTFK